MNRRHAMRLSRFLLLATALGFCHGASAAEEYTYGIEINGVLCGYARLATSPIVENGRAATLLDHEVLIHAKALGSPFDNRLRLTYRLDPATGRFTYHDSVIDQGQTHLTSRIVVDGDAARCTSNLSAEEKTIPIPAEAILENTLVYPHLRLDFAVAGLERKTYGVFEVREWEVQNVTYSMAGREVLDLAGRRYDGLALERRNEKTGLKTKLWIDSATGIVLKTLSPGGRSSYLADPSVTGRIERASLDESISTKANVTIPDAAAISYMKVRARIDPSGLRVTPESLNVPGQRFVGTVRENLVEGVFEIEHPRYDGAGAPPFPPAFAGDESLAKFLEAAEFIESDDPVLVSKAREITEGSQDSWEAARRLSRWVADNIAGAIPGGGTARKTYDIRAGECGAHSFLLAAFCRAVGIPARVVWGCLYAPQRGGLFGQHGWNEVYMGKAGWVPLDTTVGETDYVDSGHIRVGVYQSVSTALNPIEMEILEHRLARTEAQASSSPGTYGEYVGKYTRPTGDPVDVRFQDGSLVMDIPGAIAIALKDADPAGRWYSRMADTMFVDFERSPSGPVSAVKLHQIIRMERKGGPDDGAAGVPEEYRRYLGTYLLAQLQADFSVVYQDGGLAVVDPLAKRTVRLKAPDAAGRWADEFDRNGILFQTGEGTEVRALLFDKVNRFPRQAS